MPLDIGVGIFAAIFLSGWLHVPLSVAWIFAGIFFALAPDIDALINFIQFRSTKHAYHHRDLLHLPLVYVPVGTLVVNFFNPNFSLLFLICSLAHFVHDSIGIGWGVQWLWPLNTDHFSFLYLYQPTGKPPLERKLFYRFRHAEIDALDAMHGDADWVHNIYVRMHPYAIVEILVCIAALVTLYFTKL